MSEKSDNQCNVCLLKLSSKGNLKRHMVLHDEDTYVRNEKIPSCQICGKSHYINAHMRIRRKQKCDICDKEFTSLKSHMKNHINQPTYAIRSLLIREI